MVCELGETMRHTPPTIEIVTDTLASCRGRLTERKRSIERSFSAIESNRLR
ncbi:hypothetical protein CKA32_002122 [Geitlerinema sp. FC II]|nr:hypothetical protein CKA32_002122 [Geitlerinema sp. FC II]